MSPSSISIPNLLERIERNDMAVGVVGLGYVGLPLAMAFANEGFRVTAFDVDAAKIASLKRGESYIRHLDQDAVARLVREGRMVATDDFSELANQDAILVCVPTPLTPQREPDMSYVQSTVEVIARHARAGQLVVLESTTYPGTTDGMVADLLRGTGLELGRELFLAYSPEREDPGSKTHRTTTIPKLVGGVDPASGKLAAALYARAVDTVHAVPHARVAEAAKLTENVFRAVNIALVNELKVVYDRMGIDIWDVLDAAETKPFGFMRFNPGPGLGGHCIPLDPFYLSWKAREYGPPPKFIELAGEVNVQMPDYVVGKVFEALNTQAKAVRGSRILLLGVAYKPDVDDCRESPAFPIMTTLMKMGADVVFHDPHVAELPTMRHWPELQGRRSVALDGKELARADAVVVVTDHEVVDYAMVATHASLVVDTRNRVTSANGTLVRA